MGERQMIHIHIKRSGESKYIYEQIYDEIKNGILESRLIPHEKLPSKRMLAKHLQISVNSVTAAYEQLLVEGYIYTIERSGYFVEEITHLTRGKNSNTKLPDDLKEETEENDGWLSFSHISVDAKMFPFKDWLKCGRKAIKLNKNDLASPTHFQGPLEIRKTIARLIAQSRGVICEPEQIVLGAGTQSLVERLVSLYDKKTTIAVEDPGYHRIYNLLKKRGYDVLPVPLDHNGIQLSELNDSNTQLVFVTPSHQFPTGKIMPISRRNELLNWAAQHKNRYIIEDDYDSEYKYETGHIPSLQSLDRQQQVVYTGTFSKTMLPSIRISYIILPYHLLRKYRKKYSEIMHEVNAISLYTLHHFIQDGFYHKHIQQMNKHYERKRKKLVNQLKSMFQDQIEIIDVPAGLHFLAYFNTDKTYNEIMKRAQEKKLEIYTLKRFNFNVQSVNKDEIGIVIGFANISEEDIVEATNRLWQIVNDAS